MIKHCRNTIFFLFVFSLVGCASPPRTVDASIPLVEPSSFVSSESVPPRYWNILNNDKETQFIHQDHLILLTPSYHSALGTRCRQLTFLLDNMPIGSRIVCANSSNSDNSQWFLTHPLTNEQSLVDLK
ncbi:hypothetical protein [Marinomonas shanghaiensis]|uniref:hypothetical protein n=1 Tax=Marinomonas shanghaiensis TaxID=2202418 RepID=UPI003A931078